jgi:hypothetical protein
MPRGLNSSVFGYVLDASDEYWDAHEEKLFGSMYKGSAANVKGGDLRTIMSQSLLPELSFIKFTD